MTTPLWTPRGIGAMADQPSSSEVRAGYASAFTRRRTIEQARASQVVFFDAPYILLVAVGDQHFGNSGVDVERAFKDIEQAVQIPNTAIAMLGDLTDNFVVPKLRGQRDTAPAPLGHERIIANHYLTVAHPCHLLAVGGNHDHWTEDLAGVRAHEQQIAAISPMVLYDAHELNVTFVLRHAGREVAWPGRLRHAWPGSIRASLTAPIEAAHKQDSSFIWAIGAHVHASAVVRQFNAGDGKTGTAAMVGTYKRYDDYAKKRGFPPPNDATAIGLIFDAITGTIHGYNNLDAAETAMRSFLAGVPS